MNIEFAYCGNFEQRFSIFARLPTARPLSLMIPLPIYIHNFSFPPPASCEFLFLFFLQHSRVSDRMLNLQFFCRRNNGWQMKLLNVKNGMYALIVSPRCDSHDQCAAREPAIHRAHQNLEQMCDGTVSMLDTVCFQLQSII